MDRSRFPDFSNEKRCQQYIKVIVWFAVFLRSLFALKAHFSINAHDAGILGFSPFTFNDTGHLAYIDHLIKYKSFPVIDITNVLGEPSQFYHPPVFHMIAAFLKVIVNSLGLSDFVAYEVIQQVNMTFSCVSLFVCVKIFDELELSGKGKLIATMLCAFNPGFITIGTEMNNDCLMTLFCLLSILYTLKWMKRQTWKNIILIMIFLVLGMLTKTSAVLIAPAIGMAFLYKLITSKDTRIHLIKQYVFFAMTSIPLGLSWVLRNYIRFSVPFNYVPSLEKTDLQYVGNVSALKRLLLPSIEQLSNSHVDYYRYPSSKFSNIWGQMFQTMNFDEGILWHSSTALSVLMNVSSIILYIVLLVLFIKFLIRKYDTEKRLVLGFTYFTLMIMFVAFAFQYPWVCSMNFRYIAVTWVALVAGGIKYAEGKTISLRTVSVCSVVYSCISVAAYMFF